MRTVFARITADHCRRPIYYKSYAREGVYCEVVSIYKTRTRNRCMYMLITIYRSSGLAMITPAICLLGVCGGRPRILQRRARGIRRRCGAACAPSPPMSTERTFVIASATVGRYTRRTYASTILLL